MPSNNLSSSLTTAKKAEVLDLPSPVPQEYRRLAALKAKSFDELIALGSNLYVGHLDQLQIMVSSILNDTTPSPVEHKLAEAIYFRIGHSLAKQYRFGDMTRLQEEHEALALGILTQEDIRKMSQFELQVKLRFWVNREHEERFEQLRRQPSRSDSAYGSDYDITMSSSRNEDEDAGEEKKPVYVKVWKKELGKFVTYAY